MTAEQGETMEVGDSELQELKGEFFFGNLYLPKWLILLHTHM